MKNLWKVTFDAKYTGRHSPMEETVKVVANGDGMTAVAKARKQVIGMTFEDGPMGPQKRYVTRRCRYVKLQGLEKLAEIDA